jgi:hypothetical protein
MTVEVTPRRIMSRRQSGSEATFRQTNLSRFGRESRTRLARYKTRVPRVRNRGTVLNSRTKRHFVTTKET